MHCKSGYVIKALIRAPYLENTSVHSRKIMTIYDVIYFPRILLLMELISTYNTSSILQLYCQSTAEIIFPQYKHRTMFAVQIGTKPKGHDLFANFH